MRDPVIACFQEEFERFFDLCVTQIEPGLTQRHDRLSAALGKERTMQHALIGLVRHASYHLGCCDAALREHGLAGVY